MENMQQIIISATIGIVILSNCLLYEARSLYAMQPSHDIVSKRALERRGFLKSFCAMRCNIGKGGNVCRCNGFHFAGKRSSIPAVETEQLYKNDDMFNEQMIYNILEDKDKIMLESNNHEETLLPEQVILTKIQELLPQVLAEENSPFDPSYGAVPGY